MKITKRQLRRIIIEEKRHLNEQPGYDPGHSDQEIRDAVLPVILPLKRYHDAEIIADVLESLADQLRREFI